MLIPPVQTLDHASSAVHCRLGHGGSYTHGRGASSPVAVTPPLAGLAGDGGGLGLCSGVSISRWGCGVRCAPAQSGLACEAASETLCAEESSGGRVHGANAHSQWYAEAPQLGRCTRPLIGPNAHVPGVRSRQDGQRREEAHSAQSGAKATQVAVSSTAKETREDMPASALSFKSGIEPAPNPADRAPSTIARQWRSAQEARPGR